MVATINTLADWYLNEEAPLFNQPFTPDAVQKIVDRNKEAGVKRMAWRVTDGGTATYFSKLRDPYHELQADNIHKGFFMTPASVDFTQADFRKFDSYREVIDRAHRAGIEVYAWMQVAGEDDGWGYASRRVREHPEVNTVGRDGVRFNAKLAWSMPENRQYLLGLIDEILAYKPDGLILDFLKNQGDYRNRLTDDSGVVLYGYEQPAVEAFRKEHGKDPFQIPNDDPDWIRFRADYVTQFAREAREHVSKTALGLPLVAQVWGGGQTTEFVKRTDTVKPGEPAYKDIPHPVKDAYSGTLADTETWSREGLFDSIYPLISTRDLDEYRAKLTAMQKLVGSGKSKFAVGAYIWGQVPKVPDFVNIAVKEFGVKDVYLGESLPLEPAGWPVLQEAIAELKG